MFIHIYMHVFVQFSTITANYTTSKSSIKPAKNESRPQLSNQCLLISALKKSYMQSNANLYFDQRNKMHI